MKNILLFFVILLCISLAQAQVNPPSVKIGNQTWMQKNLDVIMFRNGDLIPKITDPVEWSTTKTGAYCYYNNDSAQYAATYGKLYNWYAVNDPRGLAPAGWHIPSDLEWDTLINSLGGYKVAGAKIIEKGTIHWPSTNTESTNSTAFTALPGGFRSKSGGLFVFIGGMGCWWSSSENSTIEAWGRRMMAIGDGVISRSSAHKNDGLTLRCIKD